MKSTSSQLICLLLVAMFLGLVRNLVPANSIEYIGNWRTLSSGDEPIVPPTAGEGDPPFISIDVAQMEHSLGEAVFIDAREGAEFECGTIPGSISIPFEYLPDENIDLYVDSALGGMSKDRDMIIFCSGEECDLSLHLARNMQDFGYTNLMIFFGGAREWENFDLEIERRTECGE
ncbi:MAG: rhodanese-like domain-containing protein [bacterium]|nr:rhodanese-like domain-containing protein [bacterium]